MITGIGQATGKYGWVCRTDKLSLEGEAEVRQDLWQLTSKQSQRAWRHAAWRNDDDSTGERDYPVPHRVPVYTVLGMC
jgi:hypothetical protein